MPCQSVLYVCEYFGGPVVFDNRIWQECLTRQESVWQGKRVFDHQSVSQGWSWMILKEHPILPFETIWYSHIISYYITLSYIHSLDLFGVSCCGFLFPMHVLSVLFPCASGRFCVSKPWDSEVCSGWMFQETKWLRSAHCTRQCLLCVHAFYIILYNFMIFFDNFLIFYDYLHFWFIYKQIPFLGIQ